MTTQSFHYRRAHSQCWRTPALCAGCAVLAVLCWQRLRQRHRQVVLQCCRPFVISANCTPSVETLGWLKQHGHTTSYKRAAPCAGTVDDAAIPSTGFTAATPAAARNPATPNPNTVSTQQPGEPPTAHSPECCRGRMLYVQRLVMQSEKPLAQLQRSAVHQRPNGPRRERKVKDTDTPHTRHGTLQHKRPLRPHKFSNPHRRHALTRLGLQQTHCRQRPQGVSIRCVAAAAASFAVAALLLLLLFLLLFCAGSSCVLLGAWRALALALVLLG